MSFQKRRAYLIAVVFFGIVIFCQAGRAAQAAAAPIKIDVKPTILFVEENGILKQRLDIELENSGPETSGELLVKTPQVSFSMPLEKIAAGKNVFSVLVPDIQKPAKASFTVKIGKEIIKHEIQLQPGRKWTIYLLPHSHTDIGYTDLQTRVAKNHMDYLDSVIDFCKATENYPDEAKFRWNIEVSWSLQNYIKSRPETKVEDLIALLKSGRVELSAWYLNQSDLFSHEELVRSVLFAKELSRTYGFPLRSAMNNDVTGFSWAAPQILSQVWVRYFTTGINETRSRAPLRRPNPFYWQSPDGSKILHWNGEHYLFANYDLLLHEGYEQSFPKVMNYLAKLQARGDYPYDAIAFHISGYVTDNCPPKKELSDRVREWNNHWAYPKLRLATMSEFFTAFEKKYAKEIPTYKLGWPDYWTDGAASTSFETGVNRQAHAELLSAEKWAFVASLIDKNSSFPRNEISEAYDNVMLYDEHTWGGWNSIDDPESEFARGQWTIKSSYAYKAREIARTVMNRSTLALVQNIATAEKYSFAVFNPLSWVRTDVVKIALPQPLRDKKGKFALVDKRTGGEVGFQLLDQNTLAFLAQDVPSIGYSVYMIIPDRTPAGGQPTTRILENTIENRFYKIAVDPKSGGLSSILDKESGQELVDLKAPHSLNQYIYENPEGGRKAVDNTEKRAEFKRFSPVSATVAPGMKGAAASSFVVKTKAKPCPEIKSEIILYEDLKRIDIVNTLKKEETYEPEAVYFAFPFGIAGGKFRFEIADAEMAPETEQLPGTTRDWHTVQNWVEIAGAKQSIVWSPVEAPLIQFCDINTGKWLKKLDITNTRLYSYAMNNYWMTNFKASQGGTLVFRYSITSRPGGADSSKSTRFGWEVHTPLAAFWLPDKTEGALPGTAVSFFTVDKPNVLVQAVQPAAAGRGIIIRLREVAGLDTEVKISSSLIRSEKVTFIVTDIGESPANTYTVLKDSIYVPVKAFGIHTVIIRE
jgi:alpha-mannosidase